MAYIGHSASGNFTTKPSKDTFSGDGSTTAFTLSEGATTNTVDVFVENVRQEPTTAYTVSGTTLTFTAAPGSGTNNIYVVNRGPLQLSATHPAAQALEASTGTFTGDLTVDTNTLHVDSTNNRVGVGTATPAHELVIQTASADPTFRIHADTDSSPVPALEFMRGADDTFGADIYTDYRLSVDGGDLKYEKAASGTTTEVMRLDSSGNVLVGTTDTTPYNNTSGGGFVVASSGLTSIARETTSAAQSVLHLNNTGVDGIIAEFAKDGTTVGSFGSRLGTQSFISLGSAGLTGSSTGGGSLLPTTGGTTFTDNVVDLGFTSGRFDNIYATNATIQTSDQNEKQQIVSLTSAEITAAKAISKLFKTFKWNDRVEAKGDAARTHTGVIAQEVQSAMTDAGLDATKYAFFCSDTWWETQTEVPAVEADEENGIEAQDAYTRTDTYETAEEAPEGATERTRLGIRYPELLAFIGAATEQRLADIETRLTALEAE